MTSAIQFQFSASVGSLRLSAGGKTIILGFVLVIRLTPFAGNPVLVFPR